VKTMFLLKKTFFFRAKKKFDVIFFIEVTKKNEKLLYQMKVGIKLGEMSRNLGLVGASPTEW
jgi:hypothetical protein